MLLYVILLENGKFFLYPSEKTHVDSVFLEISLLNNYVKVNPPILILETYYIWDIKEVDKYVKKYMLEQGIENVLGGSYSDIILPEYKLKALEAEFSLSKTDMISDSNMVDRIIEKYKGIGKEERVYEILTLNNKIDEYKTTKSTFEYYSTLDPTSKLDRNFKVTLTWLITYMQNDSIPNIEVENLKEFRSFYNNSMKKLQQLSQLFFKKFPEYDFLPRLHYVRPDVIFDRIFIHKRYLHDCDHSSNLANEVYNNFEFMYHKMINFLDELEFDLSTFPLNFEKEAEITIYYLTSCNEPLL